MGDSFEDEYRRLLDDEIPRFDPSSKARSLTKDQSPTHSRVPSFGACLVLSATIVLVGIALTCIGLIGAGALLLLVSPAPVALWMSRYSAPVAAMVMLVGVLVSIVVTSFAVSGVVHDRVPAGGGTGTSTVSTSTAGQP